MEFLFSVLESKWCPCIYCGNIFNLLFSFKEDVNSLASLDYENGLHNQDRDAAREGGSRKWLSQVVSCVLQAPVLGWTHFWEQDPYFPVIQLLRKASVCHLIFKGDNSHLRNILTYSSPNSLL